MHKKIRSQRINAKKKDVKWIKNECFSGKIFTSLLVDKPIF